MGHAQKPHFVFRLNGRVHLNRRRSQFSRLLAAEVCASALLMLDTPRSEVLWEYWLPTPFASFPFISPPVSHRVPPHSERSIPAIACIETRSLDLSDPKEWCPCCVCGCIPTPVQIIRTWRTYQRCIVHVVLVYIYCLIGFWILMSAWEINVLVLCIYLHLSPLGYEFIAETCGNAQVYSLFLMVLCLY